MSVYADYIRERAGKSVLETDSGFAIYEIQGEECYIQDIYVVPEKRKSGVAAAMADIISGIAKAQGCKYLVGSVCPYTKGSHASLLVLLAYGMKILRSEKDIVYFIKRVA